MASQVGDQIQEMAGCDYDLGGQVGLRPGGVGEAITRIKTRPTRIIRMMNVRKIWPRIDPYPIEYHTRLVRDRVREIVRNRRLTLYQKMRRRGAERQKAPFTEVTENLRSRRYAVRLSGDRAACRRRLLAMTYFKKDRAKPGHRIVNQHSNSRLQAECTADCEIEVRNLG